jgi:hypothetical protein
MDQRHQYPHGWWDVLKYFVRIARAVGREK